jgi:hypothetical protein
VNKRRHLRSGEGECLSSLLRCGVMREDACYIRKFEE